MQKPIPRVAAAKPVPSAITCAPGVGHLLANPRRVVISAALVLFGRLRNNASTRKINRNFLSANEGLSTLPANK